MPLHSLYLWLFLVWAPGWLMLALSRRIWRDERGWRGEFSPADGGLAAGRVLALVLWTLLTFWLGYLGVPVRVSAFIGVGILFVLTLVAWRERREIKAIVLQRRRAIITSEVAFFSIFLLFLVLRGYWPGIDNGEKPMDMALISACARADYLPPPNPYAANTRLQSYYYFGHLQTAILTNASFSQPRWTYNLMAATLPALCFSVLVSLAGFLAGGVKRGALVALVILAGGTLEPLRQWFKPPNGAEQAWPFGERVLDYMATSRVLPFAINEYPWFTFNYGDLHAHYFSMPLALLVISLSLAVRSYVVRETGWLSRPALVTFFLTSLVLGAMIVTNTWDFPMYLLLCALMLWSLNAPLANIPVLKSDTMWLRRGVLIAGIVSVTVIALAAASPFLLNLHSEARRPTFLQQPASPARSWLLMWGVFTFAWLWTLIRASLQNVTLRKAGIVLVAMGVLTWTALRLSSGMSYFVLILIVILLLWTAVLAMYSEDRTEKILARIALCGLISLLWSETTWSGFLGVPEHWGFDDFKRQDTVFKFGLQTWYLWGTASICALLRPLPLPQLSHQKVFHHARWAFVIVLPIVFAGSLLTTWERARRFEQWHGLDVWNDLTSYERSAADYMVRHARDGDHLIEAEQKAGGDYSPYTRFAHATGIPTVIGPQAHTFQWGLSWEQVFARKEAVRNFYTAADAGARDEILKTYGVKFIVCGTLERLEYGGVPVSNIERNYPILHDQGQGLERVLILQAPLKEAN